MRRAGLELDDHFDDAGRVEMRLRGELDLATAPRLQQAVARLCATEGVHALTIDLSGLEFIDSIGLAAVAYASRLCERAVCALSLIRGPESVQHVFELTGLAKQLPFRGAAGEEAPA
jgi:anti-anti-sigma factor